MAQAHRRPSAIDPEGSRAGGVGVDRREFVAALGAAGLAWTAGVGVYSAQLTPASKAVDHLILGAADLDAGIAHVERLTGVRAAIGGVHPGRGTRNALLSLGGRQYLEILAPDPNQQEYRSPMEVRALKAPRVIGWAAASTDVSVVLQRAKSAGLSASGPRDGSRARPDGRTLHWRTANIATTLVQDAVDPIPFFIEWRPDSPHPASDSPGGLTLEALDAAHPKAPDVSNVLSALGIDLAVRQAPSMLRAVLRTPKGRVELS